MFRKISPFILLRLPFICWLLITGNLLCGQSLSEIHWHFGTTSEGIRFNKSNKQAGKTGDQENASLGQGGGAVATDPLTGNLLFYTDGSNIFDADHQIMSAISGVNDHNQSAAIVPVPGQTGQYYVFYKNTGGSILYAIVDMSLGGNSNDPLFPLGDVSTVNATAGVVTQTGSEAMAVVPGEGGSHYLLVHSGTDYETYLIGTSPVLSTAPVSTLAIPKGLVAGNFAYNQAAGKIAVAPTNPSKNIQLLDFDPATGALSSAEEILNTGSGGIYDTEWSKDGKSLFISSEGQLYHYYSDTVPPQRVLTEPVFKSFGLKRGPDNKIYHLYQQTSGGPLLAGRINSPDSVTAKLSYQALAFDKSDFGGMQFPEFLPDQDIDFALDFVVVGNCANGLTKFIPQVDPLPESYEWKIADTVIHAQSPEMTFEEGGPYNVQLKVELNGKTDSVSRQVMIENNDMQIDVPSDTTICADQLPGFQLEAKVQPEGAQLTWSHGQTGPTATFDSTGYYYVVAVNSNGCEVYAGVNIKICQEEKSRANIWYFGEQAGLDFNDYDLNDDVQPPVAITDDNKMSAPAGAAAISDRNGQVLFYTNGETVWNREHEIMENGDDIGGDTNSTQSSLVVPFPGDETMFYVFTTTQGPEYELGYAIVDIKGDDGDGAVEEVPASPTIPASYTTPLFSRSTEKITAITSGDTTWLLMHELGNNTFRAYPVTQGGIGIPVLSSVGSNYSSAGGYMKFSTNGQKVASAVQGPPGFVEIYSFSDSTGMLDDSVRFDFGGEQPYGVEFSPNTDLLYVTTSQGLYQFHVSDTLSAKEMQDSKKLIESGSGFGALQTGPTGQIYMAVDGSTSIKYISSPNVLDTDTTDVQTTDFSLEGRTSKRGLPNFVQNMMEPLQEAGFEVSNACLGDSVIFSATERCDTDKFSWSFGDGNTATGQDVTHRYAAPGKYLVTLVISNPCAIPADTTIADTVEVFAPPPESDFPDVYGLCGDNDSLKVYNDPAADLTFEWSNGLTGNAIPVSVPGDYSVRVTNGNGCSITKDFQAVDARPRVELGPDQVVCQDEELDPLNARNTGATYAWTIFRDGANFAAGASQRQEISTELPGEYLYIVKVTEPENFGGCQKTDSVYITVNGTPQVEAIPTQTTACGAADGELALNILSAGDYAYSVRRADGADIASGNIANAPASITPIQNLAAGIYVVEVSDNISGCTQTVHAEVEDGNANFTIDDVDPLCGKITVTVSNNPFPLSYKLYNEEGTVIVDGSNVNASPPGKFTINHNDIVAGTYSLEVTAQNGSGCTQTFTEIEVQEVDLSVTYEDGCGQAFATASSETASALDPVSYTWTNIDGTTNGIIGNNPNIATVGFDQSGQYVIRVSAGGYCDNVDTVDITVGNLKEEDLAIVETGDPCLGEMILTVEVNVPGNYSYFWEKGGQRTQSVTVTESGLYTVLVRDTDTGCEKSANFEAEVFDPLEVMLTAEPACENEGATMIRATMPLGDTTGLVYTWNGPGGEIPGERGDSLLVTESGGYQVTVNKAGRACPPAKDDISISFSPVGISTLPTAVQIICISDPDPRVNSVLLDPDSLATFSLYRWQLNGKPLGSEKTVLANKAGIYSVTMITREGCSVTSQVEVIEDCKPQVFIPNAFRPGSGIPENRVFQIFNKEEIDPNGFQVFIFNRWGELIYQSPDKNFQWDGTFKGEPVQTGTYAYVIRYIGIFDPDKTVEEERGAVMVIR